MNKLQEAVIGNVISKVSSIEGYIQIFFADGSVLNLYNKVTFSHQYQQYSNEIVKDLIFTEFLLCIKGSDKEISMSMKEEDYSTPEAFEFCSKDDLWIIDS